MKLIYNTDATPKQMGYGQTLLFALQQLLCEHLGLAGSHPDPIAGLL